MIKVTVAGHAILTGKGGELDREPIYRDDEHAIREAVQTLAARCNIEFGDVITIDVAF